jgi:cation diffusion facilitator family transporter
MLSMSDNIPTKQKRDHRELESSSPRNRMLPGSRVTWIGALANLGLFGLKWVGGVFGHSQALLADAVHSLSDLLSDFITLLGVHYSRKPRDPKHPYGHGKIETLAAFGVGLILMLTAVGIGYSAAKSIYFHNDLRPTPLAVAIAAISIVVKEILYRVTVKIGKRERSPSLIANAWHHRSDALSSVAALIGIGGAVIFPALHVLDAVAALLVAMFVLRMGGLITWDGIRDLVDTSPDQQLITEMEQLAAQVPGVLLVHNLKARYYAKELIVDLHAEVYQDLTVADGHRIAHAIKQALMNKYKEILDVQVHIEPEGDTSMHPYHF